MVWIWMVWMVGSGWVWSIAILGTACLTECAAARLCFVGRWLYHLYKGQAGLRWAAAEYTQASPYKRALSSHLCSVSKERPLLHPYTHTTCIHTITLHVTRLGWVGIHQR